MRIFKFEKLIEKVEIDRNLKYSKAKKHVSDNEQTYYFAPFTDQRDTLRNLWRNFNMDWYEFLFKAEICNNEYKEKTGENSSMIHIVQNLRGIKNIKLKKFNEMFDPMGNTEPSQIDNTEKQVSGLIDELINRLPDSVNVVSSGDKHCELNVNVNAYNEHSLSISIKNGLFVTIQNDQDGHTTNLCQGNIEETLKIIENLDK